MDLSELYRKPIASVDTHIGTVYLYPLHLSGYSEIGKLATENHKIKFREILPFVGSLHQTSKAEQDVVPLQAEEISQISDAEVGALAEKLIKYMVKAWPDDEKSNIPPRADDQSPESYAKILILAERERFSESNKRLAKSVLGPTSDILESFRQSSSLLGGSIEEFNQFNRANFQAPQIDPLHRSIELHHGQLAQERQEELEMVRLTGQMTAQSARTLKELSDAASTMLERFDQRSQQTDQDTRRQIKVAVISVAVTAILATLSLAASLGVIYFDYKQRQEDRHSRSEFQELIARGDHRQQLLEEENDKLQVRLDDLTDRLFDLSQKSAEAIGDGAP